jgi:ABC-type Fe3+ transport system permease subunit
LLQAQASFRIRNKTDTGTSYTWGIEAWNAALAGNLSTLNVAEALANSMIFAIGTLIIALPVGWILASTIHALEISNHHRLAKALDVATLLPLAISAIMVGLGFCLVC